MKRGFIALILFLVALNCSMKAQPIHHMIRIQNNTPRTLTLWVEAMGCEPKFARLKMQGSWQTVSFAPHCCPTRILVYAISGRFLDEITLPQKAEGCRNLRVVLQRKFLSRGGFKALIKEVQ